MDHQLLDLIGSKNLISNTILILKQTN